MTADEEAVVLSVPKSEPEQESEPEPEQQLARVRQPLHGQGGTAPGAEPQKPEPEPQHELQPERHVEPEPEPEADEAPRMSSVTVPAARPRQRQATQAALEPESNHVEDASADSHEHSQLGRQLRLGLDPAHYSGTVHSDGISPPPGALSAVAYGIARSCDGCRG